MSAANEKMHYDDGLTDAERDAVIDDMHKIYSMVLTDVVNQLIALADKHNVERDNVIKHFAAVFSKMAELGTFVNWGCSNGQN